MKFSACSHVGLVRSGNEDAMAWEVLSPEQGVAFLAVADGMGGAAGGEVASRLAIDTVLSRVRQEVTHWAGEYGREEGLRQAVLAAHRALVAVQGQRPELDGMGTTFTGALVWGRSVTLAHIGDSRAYLVRGGAVTQLTNDHSVVGELVRGGSLTEDEARHHPQRNLLTSALGARGPLQLELRTIYWQPGDLLLLCTDGLTNLVPAREVADAAGDLRQFDTLAERLVQLANERGGPDNITVLSAWYDAPGSGPGAAEEVNR